MLKSVETLWNSWADKKVGNHSKAIYSNCEAYMYHGNRICLVSHEEKTVYLNNCGWATVSTNRAMNDYKRLATATYPHYEIKDNREK